MESHREIAALTWKRWWQDHVYAKKAKILTSGAATATWQVYRLEKEVSRTRSTICSATASSVLKRKMNRTTIAG